MFPPLKPFQEEALKALKTCDHTVLIAQTGSGKSLVFQKYLYDSRKSARSILVSPLNALARQLADGFERFGLTVHLGVGKNGAPPPDRSGVWIVSPEKIMGRAFEQALRWQPNCLMVDEAHCVWEWGESFRPEFAQVPHLVQRLEIQKSFWCSATLPRPALRCIENALPGPVHKIGRFSVPVGLELERISVSAHHKLARLRALLDEEPLQSGMIFVSTRASAERLQFYLSEWGFQSLFYHAGMSNEERVIIEKRLVVHDPLQPIWVVATSAFGMGMNYAFLKRCILFEPTRTLLSLAQAIGRVGRSGALARAQVFWHENDFLGMEARITDQEQRGRLREVYRWCASSECPRSNLENYFNETEKSGTFDG